MSYIRLPTKSEGRLPSIPSITEEDEPNAHKPIEATFWKCRRQVIASLIICLGIFSVGTVFGWSSVAVPALKTSAKIGNDTSSEAGAASLYVAGAIPAGPLAGYLMFKLGRKMATFWFSLVFTIGWAFIFNAQFVNTTMASEALIFSGRFLTGFASSGCLVICPVYVKEICDEKVRSTMGSMVPLVLVSGYTSMFAFGVVLSWWIMSMLSMIPPLLLCIFIFFIPNSPRHLLILEKNDEGKKAMLWLTHGFLPEERERLYKRLQRACEFLKKNTNKAMKRAERKKREKRLKLSLKSRPVLAPLMVSIILIFFQQTAGINVVGSYTQDILEAGKDSVSVDTGTVVVGIVYFCAILLATLVVDRLGRKPLLLIGITFMFIAQAGLGIYFYYWTKALESSSLKMTNSTNSTHSTTTPSPSPGSLDYLRQNYSWIPFVSLNVFITAYAIGLGSVTWILAVEINHPDFQEISGTLDSLTYWSTVFITTFTLPSLRDAIGYHWVFWLQAVACLCAFFYCFFFIYETGGKTQEEIMAHYKGINYDPEDDDDEMDTKSIGSLSPPTSKNGNKSRHSGHSRNTRTSAQSGTSDEDFKTLHETGDYDDN